MFRIINIDAKWCSVLVSRGISILVLVFYSSFYILFGKAVNDKMYPSFYFCRDDTHHDRRRDGGLAPSNTMTRRTLNDDKTNFSCSLWSQRSVTVPASAARLARGSERAQSSARMRAPSAHNPVRACARGRPRAQLLRRPSSHRAQVSRISPIIHRPILLDESSCLAGQ